MFIKTFATFLSFCLIIMNLLAQDPSHFDINTFQTPNHCRAEGNNILSQLLSAHQALIQPRSLSEKLDSSHYWEWNYSGQHWDFVSRSFFTEDIQENTASRFELRWRNKQWENSRIDSTVFDANHKPVYEITLEWHGMNWINSVLTTKTYNANNDLAEAVTQFWDNTEWENFLSIQSAYDSNHHLQTEKYGLWLNNQWDFRNQALYAYNPNHALDLSVYQILESGQWKDNSREIYTYDNNNKITIKLTQKVVAGEWTDWRRILYDYNDHGRNLIIQEFINGSWENQSHYIETTNSNQNVLSTLHQIWQLNWVNKDSSQYYYSMVIATKDVSEVDAVILIYPNPANNWLNIHLAEKSFGDIKVEIYSNIGIKVIESIVNPLRQMTVDISQLVPGSYHVLIQKEKGITNRNFVKL